MCVATVQKPQLSVLYNRTTEKEKNWVKVWSLRSTKNCSNKSCALLQRKNSSQIVNFFLLHPVKYIRVNLLQPHNLNRRPSLLWKQGSAGSMIEAGKQKKDQFFSGAFNCSYSSEFMKLVQCSVQQVTSYFQNLAALQYMNWCCRLITNLEYLCKILIHHNPRKSTFMK